MGPAEGTATSEPRLIQRIEMVHQFTVQELVDWCLQRDLDPAVVTLTGGHLKWRSPLTAQEAARDAEWNERQEARRAKWERETYERLRARFDGGA